PSSREATRHSVDLQRRTRPGAVEHRISRLPRKHFGANFSLAVMLLIERQALPGFQLVFAWRLGVLIKAWNQNSAFAVLQLADDSNEREKRIRRSATVHPGV